MSIHPQYCSFNTLLNFPASASKLLTLACEAASFPSNHLILGNDSTGCLGSSPKSFNSPSTLAISSLAQPILSPTICKSNFDLNTSSSVNLLNAARYTGFPGLIAIGLPLYDVILIISACESALSTSSPPFLLSVSTIKTSLYLNEPSSDAASILTSSHACCAFHRLRTPPPSY